MTAFTRLRSGVRVLLRPPAVVGREEHAGAGGAKGPRTTPASPPGGAARRGKRTAPWGEAGYDDSAMTEARMASPPKITSTMPAMTHS